MTSTQDAKRQLQKKLQDDELQSTTSAAAESGNIHDFHTMAPLTYIFPTEFKAAIGTYQQKEQSYLERLEAAEIARATAARGEAYGESDLCHSGI